MSARSITSTDKKAAHAKKVKNMTPAQKEAYKKLTLIEDVIGNLETIIKTSKELMHIDLSNTGLNEKMMLRVVKAIKMSQSLMGVHLSGNEGLTPSLISKAERKLDATHERKRDVNFRDIME